MPARFRLHATLSAATLGVMQVTGVSAQDAIAPATPATQPIRMSDTQVAVSDSGTVEMHVSDVALLDVLRMLSIQSRKNIIASSGVTGRVTANLYSVTMTQALDAILISAGYVYREKDNFIYVYTAKELADLEKSQRKFATEVFRLYYTPATNAATMIKPALSTDAQVAVTAAAATGIDTANNTDAGGNSHAAEDMLVVTDYSDNLDRVRKILKELDRRPRQVLVEATILAATLNDNNALGVDFSVLGGIKFDEFLTSPSETSRNASNASLTNPIGGDPGGVGKYSTAQTGFTNNVPAGGLRVGVLTNNVSIFVQALESVTNTTVLANPKVLSLDKQRGYVHIGRSDGYQTTTVSQTTSTQTVQFLDSGTTLVFRPFIGDDGYVRMEVHPEDSAGGLTASNLPFKSVTEVTTNMMVKDGRTIVIGGLFREASSTSRSQVPGVGNVPLLGALFRQKTDSTQRQEIIVLLTPHVLKDDSSYDRLSDEAKKRMEQIRIGVRKGMMPFGRLRLAESCYESAVAELAKQEPDRELALWHLNNATNLNPQFVEAIELKAKVSGKRVTETDSSVIRDFVTRSILGAQGAPQDNPPPSVRMP